MRYRTDCSDCDLMELPREPSTTQCIFCRRFFCGAHAIAHACKRDLFAWMRGVVSGLQRGDVMVGEPVRDRRKSGPRGLD